MFCDLGLKMYIRAVFGVSGMRHINETPESINLHKNTSHHVYMVESGPSMRPLCVTNWPKKKERQSYKERIKPHCGKLGIRPDDPRRRTNMKFCMVGGLSGIVLRVQVSSKSV